METFFANLIRNVTGKEFTYNDSFYSSKTEESLFLDVIFDGEYYQIMTFGEDGIIKLFKKHPEPRIIKFASC